MSFALSSTRRRRSGFTLIEMLVVIAIGAVLAAIAYPSLAGSILKVRRGDALVALMQLQQAQERWRSNHTRYATLTELGTSTRTANGHYTLSISDASSSGYSARAVAAGAQASDADCAYLQLELNAGSTRYRSGATEQLTNADGANRRCWNS